MPTQYRRQLVYVGISLLKNCTVYANTANYYCDSLCNVINNSLMWLKRNKGIKAFCFSLDVMKVTGMVQKPESHINMDP